MYGAETSGHRPHSKTPLHNGKGQAISPSLPLVLVELRWYEKKHRTNEEEEGAEKREKKVME